MSKAPAFISFRDPSGYLFRQNQSLYRQINRSYQNNYDQLISSGLYKELTTKRLLIPHQEVSGKNKVIKPEPVPFISYPYEWCFSQLKEAAITTLRIQKIALSFKMSLKDASAYNIQFYQGKPILIDTLSFETYEEDRPWIAYRQFCEHFLAPLALMSYQDAKLAVLFRLFTDGISLNLAQKLLPFRSYFNFSLLTHIHLFAASNKYVSKLLERQSKSNFSLLKMLSLLESLESAVLGMKVKVNKGGWASYYDKNSYLLTAFQHKVRLVKMFLKTLKPQMVWDLGANTGFFSQIASDYAKLVISLDNDADLVENNYRSNLNKKKFGILPLVNDLTNPSPGQGFAGKELLSLTNRGPADTTLVLALIHHLAIAENIPLTLLALYFSSVSRTLIIEFIPKTDPMVQNMLVDRNDIFPDYNQAAFEKTFSQYFTILKKTPIKDSQRIIYLMKKNE